MNGVMRLWACVGFWVWLGCGDDGAGVVADSGVPDTGVASDVADPAPETRQDSVATAPETVAETLDSAPETVAETLDTTPETLADTSPETLADTTPETLADLAQEDTDGALEVDVVGDVDPGDVADSGEDVADAALEVADTDVAPDGMPDVPDDGADGDADDVDAEPDVDPSTIPVTPGCNTVITTHPIDPSPHVASCSAVAYTTNPPTSGPHYPVWAAFKTYTSAVNPGFLVHSMEHGAVVVHHRCGDTPCASELADLASLLAARPADPRCVAPVHHRFIVTPSVSIPSRFAVSAWGAALTSDCFDLVALGGFLDSYYAKGPEDFCSAGVDLDGVMQGSAIFCPPVP